MPRLCRRTPRTARSSAARPWTDRDARSRTREPATGTAPAAHAAVAYWPHYSSPPGPAAESQNACGQPAHLQPAHLVDWRAWQVSLLWCGRTTSAQLLAALACSSRLISDTAARAAAGPTGLDGADTPRSVAACSFRVHSEPAV